MTYGRPCPASDNPATQPREARALNLRAYLAMMQGDFAEAERDLREAETVFVRLKQPFGELVVLHNLALIRFFRGELPATLSAFADLTARYTTLGEPHLELAMDNARALLVAGLSDEAVDVIDAASEWAHTRPRASAELLLMQASARLGQHRPGDALADAAAARRLFVRQQRDWWRIRADLVALRARIELGRGSRRAAVALADSPADDRTEDGVLAALLAGRELARSDPARASTYLSKAALGRHRGNPLSRSTARLAHALDPEVQGRPRGAAGSGAGARRIGRAPRVPRQSGTARPHRDPQFRSGRPGSATRSSARSAGSGAVERPGARSVLERNRWLRRRIR
ncbi:hypothetical protein [Nocardioides sp. B-3]|uniref:hypothetical protein n=1 Tax=Nocardioides sp. B-3 TaxID=2895565 RepID=UPI0021537254|nr:hypothetical protein [Nocardioides sp. B-3]UUZ61406.1 hypothetical protein LP418_13025 [Nocardioides sp. B-3]